MKIKYISVVLLLFLIVQPIPVKATTSVYADPKNDVRYTDTLDYYYTDSSILNNISYLDIINITLTIPFYLSIFVRGGLNDIGAKSIQVYIEMNINTTDKMNASALYYDGSWGAARLNYWVNDSLIWYQGLLVDVVSDVELNLHYTDKFQLPYELTCRMFEIINHNGSPEPPYFVDFYPNSKYERINESTQLITGIDNIVLFAVVGVAIVGGISIYLTTYFTSCDRKYNVQKNRCKAELRLKRKSKNSKK